MLRLVASLLIVRSRLHHPRPYSRLTHTLIIICHVVAPTDVQTASLARPVSGFLTAAAIHIAITLITGWITLIDGGKNKVTPPWAVILKRFSYFGLYLVEILLSNLQYHVGISSEYKLYMDGTVTAIKNYWYCCTCFTYSFLGLIYGRKISKQVSKRSDR